MYARPPRYRRALGGAGEVYTECSRSRITGPNARGCNEELCLDTDSFGDPVGDWYVRQEYCSVYADARSEVVNLPSGEQVTYQERTEYITPMDADAPSPDSAEWDAWVEAARQGEIYARVVSASAGTGEGAVFVPAGTFEPGDYVPGADPDTAGLPRGALPDAEYAPEWWTEAAFGNGYAAPAPTAAPASGVSPLLLAAGAGLLLLVLPRRRRAA